MVEHLLPQPRKMNEKQISECMYISQITAFHSPALLHQPDEQRFVIFCFLLDCSFSVIAGAPPLAVYWYDALWWMHAGSFNLQAGFGILRKSRCWSLFVCLTSSINELMCVQLLVKLSLDCVYSEMEGSDTAVQTGNPVISSRCPQRPKKQVRCDVAWVPVSTPF